MPGQLQNASRAHAQARCPWHHPPCPLPTALTEPRGHTPIPWFPQAGFCRATASCGFLDATRGPGTEKHPLLWVLCGLPYPSASREAAARLPDAAQKLHSTPSLRPACIIPLPSVLSSLIIPRRVSAEQQNILRVRETTFTRRTGNGSNRAIRLLATVVNLSLCLLYQLHFTIGVCVTKQTL